jgi:hypothetical protein
MFDRKAQAEAMILDDQGSGHTITRDLHGVDWDHHKYIVEVRPAGQASFRVEAKTKVPIFSAPQPGDLVTVSYEPKSQKTEIQIEGDPRYDPKLIRENKDQQKAARAEALLSGATPPGVPGIVDDLDEDGPDDDERDDDEPRLTG